MSGAPHLLLSQAGDIHLKSDRTRQRLRRALRANIEDALGRHAPSARLADGPRGRMLVVVDDPTERDAAARACSRVAGIHRVVAAERVEVSDFDELVSVGAAHGRTLVAGRRFAVRVRRRGKHEWSSVDAERAIGAELVEHSAGVSLSRPDVEVRVEVFGHEVWLLGEEWTGNEGLPVGTQAPVLSLLSGGFDSPVAAWMLMRRGCPIDFVHFMMDCSQSDHAVAVAYGLWEQWGAGSDPVVCVVDFEQVKEALTTRIESAQRQVILKQVMFAAAGAIATRARVGALVTGEAVGQVSSQTVTNLVHIDRATDRTVLRPLAGLTKNEILTLARRAGTHDLSARAKEVCDLSTGPVEVAARRSRLAHDVARLPGDLVTDALARRRVLRLADWYPGCELVDVTASVPDGFTVVDRDDPVPEAGPVAVVGRDAARRASRLVAGGREAVVLEPVLEASLPDLDA